MLRSHCKIIRVAALASIAMQPISGRAVAQDVLVQNETFGHGAHTQFSIPARLSENPVFQLMIDNGFEAGDKGTDQPNRFDDPMAEFLSFTQVSQDFILKAFTAGKLTESPNSRSLEMNNGILAIVLIDLVGDMETLAKFVETREVPESGHLPRTDTTIRRILNKYPNTAEIITPDMQQRIVELEAEVDRVLDEELERSRQQLAQTQEELTIEVAETERLRAENEALRYLEGKMRSIYNAVNI